MHGVVAVWKEAGMTSFDVVFKLRKIFETKKIGHTGTLDPDVEGILPICVGDATRIAELLTDSGKKYSAEIALGKQTTTEDSSGEVVVEDLSHKRVTREEIQTVLQQLTGSIEQTPPMYSAVKVNGKRLYEYARQGKVIERPSRQVDIYAIQLKSEEEIFEGEEIRFSIDVHCGKGTYIRTLAVQIGELLGYPAHMSHLVRTMSAAFEKEQALTLRELEQLKEQGEISSALLPIETALSDYPCVAIEDEDLLFKVENGQVLSAVEELKTEPYVSFSKHGKIIAMYQLHPTKTGQMKPFKMFPFNR